MSRRAGTQGRRRSQKTQDGQRRDEQCLPCALYYKEHAFHGPEKVTLNHSKCESAATRWRILKASSQASRQMSFAALTHQIRLLVH